jgi:hypothetical protein
MPSWLTESPKNSNVYMESLHKPRWPRNAEGELPEKKEKKRTGIIR